MTARNKLTHFDRRTFLKAAGGSAAGLILASQVTAQNRWWNRSLAYPTLSKFTEQLPIPPVIDATQGGTFNLPMAGGVHNFHSSLPAAATWGYGGASYLGPTINAKRGVPITVIAENNLGTHPLDFAVDPLIHGASESDKTHPRVSLHLHGGNTEPESDGHPDDTFLPGAAKMYHYANDQEAANLWYHDHALGITRLNVMAGLAGFYFMRDEFDTGTTDNPIGLPSGEYEVPLVIQDRAFDTSGQMTYPPGPLQIWSSEFFGDVAVVNGKAFPNFDVDRALYRFRVINGSNARVYDLYLSDDHSFFQIGSDGGLIDHPVPMDHLIIAPGERADLLIDFSKFAPGSRIVLKNSAPTPFPDGPRNVKRGGMPIKEIMQFTVGSNVGPPSPIPTVLRNTPVVPLTDPVRVRNLSLVEIMDMATDEPLVARLNNLPFETTSIEEPVVDTVEQWNIINTTGDMHPIHLHLVQFQVMSRQKFQVRRYVEAYYGELDHETTGPYPVPSADRFRIGKAKGPEPNETGWKDTVRANPGEITTIKVPFGANAAPGVPFGRSFTGDYVWHCHILEHEDNEMMLPYRVVAA